MSSQPVNDAEPAGIEPALPPIPAKRYFTIGEVSELCAVKPHVLRYWEQEFTQLRPMKRRGNRRYYQHHEVLLVRRIRDLLYEQGFTISGARNRLGESFQTVRRRESASALSQESEVQQSLVFEEASSSADVPPRYLESVRADLEAALQLLESDPSARP